MRWVTTAGGPQVALPRAALGAWSGEAGPASDYDRACDVEGCVARLEVGGCDALVLGGEPLDATYVTTAVGPMFVRVSASALGQHHLPPADSLVALAWTSTGVVLVNRHREWAMVDAAEPGAEARARLDFELPPGTWAVDHGEYRDEEVALLLERLRRIGGAPPAPIRRPG